MNLEVSIPQGKKALEAHEENLTALIGIQSRLRGLSSAENVPLELEDHSRGLHQELKNRADAPVNRSSSVIDDQIDQLQKEIRSIQDKVRELELELKGWQRSHRLSTTTFQNLMENKEKMEEDMKEGRGLLSPIPRVPSEVWVDIFGRCVQLEMEEYALGDSMVPLRSSAFILSQVCHDWRNMVLQERNLWDFITIHPYWYWSRGKYHFFTTLLSRSSKKVTLVVNPSQSLSWVLKYAGNNQYTYTNNHGDIIDEIEPHRNSEMDERSYNMHIVVKDEGYFPTDRLQSIPFRQPVGLDVTILRPYTRSLFGWIHAFPSIMSLTFNQECPDVRPWPAFPRTFSKLVTLKFHIRYFLYSFPIESFLIPSLKELHLHDKSKGRIPWLLITVQLPHLEILGVSFPGSNVLSKIEAPLLSTLLLYGPAEPPEPAMVSLATDDDETNIAIFTLLKQLTHLQFEDWTASAAVVSCLREIWKRMHRLERLTFSSCYVDGETLISTINPSRLPADDQLPLFSSLASIMLSRTAGITQAECEILRGMGKMVTIYV